MSRLCVALLMFTLVLGILCRAGEAEDKSTGTDEIQREGERREKRSMPYWNLWSSDFYGWVEELRSQAGYDNLLDLARTYWAHFPIANSLGYDPSPEPEVESKADE